MNRMRSRAGTTGVVRLSVLIVPTLVAMLLMATAMPAVADEASDPPSPSPSEEPIESAPAPTESESTPTESPAPPAASLLSTTLDLVGTRGLSGRSTQLTVSLADSSGAPVADVEVEVQRRSGESWNGVTVLVTGADGTAQVSETLGRSDASNVFRASFAGTDVLEPATTSEVTPELMPWSSVATLTMPSYVIDERATRLNVLWRTAVGDPVGGLVVQIERVSRGKWVPVRTVRTGKDGRATLVTTIRSDSQWRVRGLGAQWVKSDISRVRHLDNRPPRAPVSLPAKAPRPTVRLPAQPRVTTAGPDLVISSIPKSVWAEMSGITWTRGCPVGRSALRLIRINYWAFDGYRRRGEIVVHKDIATKTTKVFTSLYWRRIPIRSMYRVDRFGYNSRLRGGDDYKSMAAGNTSGFNCRRVVNSPSRVSPHSYGRSIDVNPWENPFRSRTGYTPNAWWASRSHPEAAWRSARHIVVQVMRYNRFRWTYGAGDLHHFDG